MHQSRPRYRQLHPPHTLKILPKMDILSSLPFLSSSAFHSLWTTFRSLSTKDLLVTEGNKKKEAEGVEKRAISKITNVGEAPLSGCRIQGKIDWKGVTFALVLLATIDVSLKRLSGKKEKIYHPVTCSVTRIEKLLKFLEKIFPKA